MKKLIDEKERAQAIDTRYSFIVQAPAGSGKTELLTQRFLALLAKVKHAPEEIVAITFTRKAAGEMQTRLLESLLAAENSAPLSDHELQTWKLAKKVLDRDKKYNWNLLKNPNRLRILTIDSLCAQITKAAPILSRFGSIPNVIEDARVYYQKAARALLTQIEDSTSWSEELKKLLIHLDINFNLLENLFIGMLARRDQWLGFIMEQRSSPKAKERLELGLKNLIEDTLQSALNSLSPEIRAELLSLMVFSAKNLHQTNSSSNILSCVTLTHFPNAEASEVTYWKEMAELLLTKEGNWRRTINKNNGFPSSVDAVNQEQARLFKTMKCKMLNFLNTIHPYSDLLLVFKEIMQLPSSTYTNSQWEVVSSLIILLPILVAHLTLIFQDENVVDFIAITQGATHALDNSNCPTNLALNLDYKIQHLLVDEFQDTSLTHLRLLELLTAGWECHDGRTLFFVGDPMQSIYRFREAEVSNFLQVKKYGLNQKKLISLNLKTNFRSNPAIVNWFNLKLKSIFPKKENIELGAIKFNDSLAFSNQQEGGVEFHTLNTSNEEAVHIVNLIKKEITENVNQSIAVLGRSRNHLQSIISELKKTKILFQAVEIEKLIHSSAVRDLFALTKATFQLGDRVAWLSILRAPWCGLTLNDLFIIANAYINTTIWETIKNFHQLTNLSFEGVSRLQRIVPILERLLYCRGRGDIRQEISYAWYLLGGPACLEEEYEIQNIQSYFNLLEKHTKKNKIDFEQLEQQLHTAYCSHSPPNPQVQLMTIHKAKGLEFDVVILPSLEKKPAIDENRLLIWLTRQNSQGVTDLILAPIKPVESKNDVIYQYIKERNKQKNAFEVIRLLYVAVTRPKKKLHLLGSLTLDKSTNEVNTPPTGSFMNLLWPVLENEYKQISLINQNQPLASLETKNNLHRLGLNWKNVVNSPELIYSPNKGNYQINRSTSQMNLIGKLIHEYLDYFSQITLSKPWDEYFHDEIDIIKNKFFQLGMLESEIVSSSNLLLKAIEKTLKDNRGQWILSRQHLAARSEFELSVKENDKIQHYRLDRTFIDETGIRWIIDYKTGNLTKEMLPSLTIVKKHYEQQLNQYARAFQLLENRKIKLGIYFPLFSGWYEWEYQEG